MLCIAKNVLQFLCFLFIRIVAILTAILQILAYKYPKQCRERCRDCLVSVKKPFCLYKTAFLLRGNLYA